MAKNYWLMKTEPDVFSFEDLVKAKAKTTSWEGVRNYQARNFMRDQMKKGDLVFIYHSNTEDPAIMGIAEVSREAYPDPDALNPKSKYFDKKAKDRGENPWVMVDVTAKARMQEPVTRSRLKDEPKLKEMLVLKKGMRLSIQPVTAKEWEFVKKMGAPKSV